MSKFIGSAAGFDFHASGYGVEMGQLSPWTPTQARQAAALLIQAADEVERMRDERVEFAAPGVVNKDATRTIGRYTRFEFINDSTEAQPVEWSDTPPDLSGNPRFERGG